MPTQCRPWRLTEELVERKRHFDSGDIKENVWIPSFYFIRRLLDYIRPRKTNSMVFQFHYLVVWSTQLREMAKDSKCPCKIKKIRQWTSAWTSCLNYALDTCVKSRGIVWGLLPSCVNVSTQSNEYGLRKFLVSWNSASRCLPNSTNSNNLKLTCACAPHNAKQRQIKLNNVILIREKSLFNSTFGLSTSTT